MKKLVFLLNVLLIFVLMISCSDSSRTDGNWSDNIHLSQKTANFGVNGGSVTITSQGNWWLNGISLNNVPYDVKDLNKLATSFVFENSDIKVEKIDSKTLLIKANSNTSNKARVFVISIQSGDYFDSIKVNQE